jgi:hypothetical protein
MKRAILASKKLTIALLTFGVLAITPLTALAGNVLFHGHVGAIGVFTKTWSSIPSASPQVLATTPDGFTLPAGVFSKTGSTYTGTFAGYPYFKQVYDRRNLAGVAYVGGAVSGTVTRTGASLPQVYPSSGAITVPPGFIRVKGGTFGGTLPMSRATTYTGTFAATTGYSDFGFFWGLGDPGHRIAAAIIGATSGRNTRPIIISTAMNQTIPNKNGGAIWAQPVQVKFKTGTITISNPSPFEATYATGTGMDDRTPNGQSGTIQLIAARKSAAYITTVLPPPGDGTSAIQNQRSGAGSIDTLNLTFMPEPTQAALLAAGVLGLGVLLRMRRR